MDATRTFRHNAYELLCGSKRLANGMFVPTLIVSKQAWPSRPRTIAVVSGAWSTEEDALTSAYAQGVEWVLNYG